MIVFKKIYIDLNFVVRIKINPNTKSLQKRAIVMNMIADVLSDPKHYIVKMKHYRRENIH